MAFVARTTTSASTGASVWFWITTERSNASPKLRKRGALGLTISGSRAVIVASLEPKKLAPAEATVITR
ncbi:hypothetical protein [Vulgatibacter incomptus]|uniref:hypothetical protein n=1 Tax=Vulgatibacter incomptus TaxID=1391653 RepID=UPI001F0B0C93|nr:hypothetical protein [Vulgatibacter incomptus]